MKPRWPLILLSTSLASCVGNPPDESDIRQALEKNTAETIVAGEELEGKAWAERMRKESKVYSVHLTGPCVEEQKRKFRCPIEVDWANVMAPRHTEKLSPLVYQGSSGWTLPVDGDDRYRNR